MRKHLMNSVVAKYRDLSETRSFIFNNYSPKSEVNSD